MHLKFWLCGLLLALLPRAGAAEKDFILKNGDKVLFIGDSNTYADEYIQYLDAYLFTRFPFSHFELINRGMPSETVAGTSETTHIPPRPDLHTRFERTVPPINPNFVMACYGMNDGIYALPNAANFAKFQEGIRWMIQSVEKKTHAPLIIATPPPFDPLPYKNKPPTNPPDYRRPDSGYDATLSQYSGWLLSLHEPNVTVIDLHRFISELLTEKRRSDPDYILAGDGVHLNATGHMLWALQILHSWNAPSMIARTLGRSNGHELIFVSPLPMPKDAQWDKKMVELAHFDAEVNQLRLDPGTIGLKPGDYILTLSLKESQASKTSTEIEVREGREIDLSPLFESLVKEQTARVLALVKARRQKLLELWVRDDPHPRLAGMYKNSRVTPAEIISLEQRIRKLCKPVTLHCQFEPSRR
jgi:lysophospholipase L1-like esterase